MSEATQVLEPTRSAQAAASLNPREAIGASWRQLRAVFQAMRERRPGAAPSAEPFFDLQAQFARLGLPWHAEYCAMQALRLHGAAERLCDLPAPSAHWGGDIWGESADVVLTRQAPLWPHASAIAQVLSDFQAEQGQDDWLSALFMLRLSAMLQPQDTEHQRQWVKRAAALEPILGESAHTLARWRLRGGDAGGAAQAALGAVRQSPQRFGSWLLRAEALIQLGQHAAAQEAFAQASKSPNPAFLAWLAEVMYRNNLTHEALQVRERVVKLTPQDAKAWAALAELQHKLWQQDEAGRSLARAVQLQPDMALVQRLEREIKGRTDSRQQFDEEYARWRREGLRDNVVGSARLLMQSLYQDHLPAQEVAQLHLALGAALEAQLALPSPPPFERSEVGQRPLRVGYVSGDFFRQHPVNVFMLPVLQHHDAQRVEVFVYATGTMIDEYTHMARQAAHHWRSVQAMSDRALTEMIRQDGIDVLIDLAGHTSSQRLGVFAMRAAPVQMSYLGYPHSTGLPCMDHMLVDGVVAPPEHEARFSEGLLRLPGSVFCWAPVDDYPLKSPEHETLSGPLVFGSFNNLLKLSDRCVRLWSQVLQAEPDSVLLIKAPVLNDPAAQRRTLERFAEHGIGPQRLHLRGPTELSQMMAEYHEVHVALDPTPYNGGTTSLQALWMGVPLVTLLGDNFVSRMGASFLHAMGCDEWVAHDEAQYVNIAQGLAQRWRQRGWSRQAQRQTMAASTLCDITAHTRAMEDAYLSAWQAWRATQA